MEKHVGQLDVEKLKDIVLRIERCEKAFNTKIDAISILNKTFDEKMSEFVLEVEMLKDVKNKTESILKGAVEEGFNVALPHIIQQLVHEYVEKTEKLSKKLVEKTISDAKNLNSTIENTIVKAKNMINMQHASMTRRRIALIAAICLSSLSTAFGINYFYPRYVNYYFSSKMVDSMILGEAVRDVFGEFTPKQKEKVLDQYGKRFKESLKNQGLG